MSSRDVAIWVRGLSKSYTIAHNAVRHSTLAEAVMDGIRRPFRKQEKETFWALREVEFQVKKGDVVGVIGRNGAGKSTLLKVLSQITEPTSGQINLYGRVGSLLEVGTGFHPELTGRENIYLNGAILGMKRREIDRQFDAIVDFAEVEQFLDTPVKRYSSGMYVRLAFAVAAHLNPEILIVDEVLAVGDSAFQKKCLGKMGDVSRQEGRTVLFVSHNMGAVRNLCRSAMWIEAGRVKQAGSPDAIIDAYLNEMNASARTAQAVFPDNPAKDFLLRAASVQTEGGDVTQNFDCDRPIVLELVCQANKSLPGLYGYLAIQKTDGTTAMISDSFDSPPNPLDNLPAGEHTVRITIPRRTLGPGDYTVYVSFASLSSANGYDVDVPGTVLSFRVDDYTSRRGNQRQGYFSTMLDWRAYRDDPRSLEATHQAPRNGEAVPMINAAEPARWAASAGGRKSI